MKYVIGSIHYDYWHLAAFRVADNRITSAQWTPDRSGAVEFNDEQRRSLSLPFGGYWILVTDHGRLTEGAVTMGQKARGFEVATEADEI